MLKTLYLGKLSGIQVYIHWSFWLLVIYFVLGEIGNGFGSALSVVGFVFMVFFCVFLHELGHAFSGRWYGVKTLDITLYPIGGVARMQLRNLSPTAELVIAACGPLVNLVLAIVLAAILFLQVTWEQAASIAQPDIARLGALEQLLLVNVALFCFNLLPVFPMDGGRILRSILRYFVKTETAIEWSARIGQILAGMLIIYGLFTLQITLVIIFVIMFLACSAELFQVRLRREVEKRGGLWTNGGAASGFPPGPFGPSPFGPNPFGAGTSGPPFDSGPTGRDSSNGGGTVDAEDVRRLP